MSNRGAYRLRERRAPSLPGKDGPPLDADEDEPDRAGGGRLRPRPPPGDLLGEGGQIPLVPGVEVREEARDLLRFHLGLPHVDGAGVLLPSPDEPQTPERAGPV